MNEATLGGHVCTCAYVKEVIRSHYQLSPFSFWTPKIKDKETPLCTPCAKRSNPSCASASLAQQTGSKKGCQDLQGGKKDLPDVPASLPAPCKSLHRLAELGLLRLLETIALQRQTLLPGPDEKARDGPALRSTDKEEAYPDRAKCSVLVTPRIKTNPVRRQLILCISCPLLSPFVLLCATAGPEPVSLVDGTHGLLLHVSPPWGTLQPNEQCH